MGKVFKYKQYTGFVSHGDLIAKVKNATFDVTFYDNRSVIDWKKGTWLSGIWIFGTWHSGVWRSGEWRNGTWLRGRWYDGVLHSLAKGVGHVETETGAFFLGD